MRDHSEDKKLSLKNIGYAVIALSAAFVMWAYITIKDSQIKDFPGGLIVEMKKVPPNHVLMNGIEKVNVLLDASSETWKQINTHNLKAEVNLAELKKGNNVADIIIVCDIPGVTILETKPNKMIIRLEQIIEKIVQVNVIFEGDPKTGFVASETIIDPEEVTIKGPKSILDEISQADININIENKSRDFSQRVPITILDKKIDFKPRSVNVIVNIIASSGSKTVGVRVKTEGKLKPNYYISKIESIPSVVDISSKENIISQINFLETEVIDLGKLEKSSVIDAKILIPDKIFSNTKKVKVKITLLPLKLEKKVIATFDYANNPDFQITDIESVRVVVSGSGSLISALDSDQVIIHLNLKDINSIADSIEITKEMISVPKGVKVINFLPKKVKVSLEKN